MNNGLLEALQVIGWPDLPKAIDGTYNKVWLKAIARVQRTNGDIGYCLVANNGENLPRIIRDFSPTGMICRILSIHPYEDKPKRNIVPHFANDAQILKYFKKTSYKQSEIESLLSKEGKTQEQIKADMQTINEYIQKVAIEQSKKMIEVNQQAREAASKSVTKNKRTYGRANSTKTERGKK